MSVVGKSLQRKDAWSKVTGKAQYTDDLPVVGVLCARLLTATVAHARINRIDISKALRLHGVKSV
jgi:CO/xanthine dehydrogenase Mo-binding subunit